MRLTINILLHTLFVAFICCLDSHAQSKALSSSWSYNGIGIGYEQHIDEKKFIQVDLRSEFTELFYDNKAPAGVSASFTWNVIFAQHPSRHGNKIIYFAGPGASIGWAKDIKAAAGLFFGLKGRIGAQCIFDRGLALSVSASPVIGMHASAKKNAINMRLYRNGLTYGLLPEVGIKYLF